MNERRGPLRPPNWQGTLTALRDAVRSGEINGTAGEMAAQVREIIIERAEMVYKPETPVSAVEWPNGWGDGARGINAACIQFGVKTLAELAEFGNNAVNLMKFRVAVGEKAARVNYAMRLARGVCGRRDPDDKVNRSFVHQDGPPRAAAANETLEEEPADEQAEEPSDAEGLNGAPRMPRPGNLRKPQADMYDKMDQALADIAAGLSNKDVDEKHGWSKNTVSQWRNKDPEFKRLGDLARSKGAPAKPDVGQEIIRQEVDEDLRRASLAHERETDDEPFPPFPEDEPTVHDERAADHHTRPTDKIEKSEPAEPRFLCEEVNRGFHPVTGDAMTLDALNDRITGVRGRVEALGAVLSEAVDGLADKFQKLFEETGRIGRDVAEALGRLWVADASVHPFVLGLVQSLPAPGTVWTLDDRRRWVHCAETVFALMYKLPVTTLQDEFQKEFGVSSGAELQDLIDGGVPTTQEAEELAAAAKSFNRTARKPKSAARRQPPAGQPVRRSRQSQRA